MTYFESSVVLVCHIVPQLHHMTHIHLQASRLNTYTFLTWTEKLLYGCMVGVWVLTLYGAV